jgi:hypothetical protein
VKNAWVRGEYLNDSRLALAPAMTMELEAAEDWSMFDPTVHASHFASLRQLLKPADRLQR